ncbi:hypothetical protein [Arthrobacter sp. ISL-95]|uniref:hypothetical protein n=1 Tax=Arthrobacter sp. ISL-95 TaxID=2819116 RepID=UPI001BE6CED3|nr:hypothetical protein [Arthrobacter sp. ISL-95]MBT2586791.1 hypothetical protein [Arthrobacter sp. ISL-95]
MTAKSKATLNGKAHRNGSVPGAAVRRGRRFGKLTLILGIALTLAGVGLVAFLLVLTGSGTPIREVFPDDRTGTTTIAAPFLVLMFGFIALVFGNFALRGTWSLLREEEQPRGKPGTWRVDLRPINPVIHGFLVLVGFAAWFAVLALPAYLDTQGLIAAKDGSTARSQLWFIVVVYGLISGAITAMVAMSLLKKLTYNRLLARSISTLTPGPKQAFWWRFSHIWRGELGAAAVGGSALGLAPLAAHFGSGLNLALSLTVGLVAMLLSAALALNSWRSGMPVERVESYT